MADATTAFVGKIPEYYERCLAPLFFNDFADDLVARLTVSDDMRVLEVACGTGIVTRRLVERLGGRGTVMATDLNAAMFAHARKRLPGSGDATYRPAHGTGPPVGSRSYHAVGCPFRLI